MVLVGVGIEEELNPFRPTRASSGTGIGAVRAIGIGNGTAAPGWSGICEGPVVLGVKLGAARRVLLAAFAVVAGAGAGAAAFAVL